MQRTGSNETLTRLLSAAVLDVIVVAVLFEWMGSVLIKSRVRT
jgi:hypothetical protein